MNWKKAKEAINIIKDAQARKQTSVPQGVLGWFDEWELELRDLKQKYGLGSKRRDARFAMIH